MKSIYTKINLDDIIISDDFKNSIPKKSKMTKCRDYYEMNQKLDRDIVLNKNNLLIDGYVGYLILKEKNIKATHIVKDIGTVYVFGKHDFNDKTYVWKLTESQENKMSDINIGDRIWVKTANGVTQITITGIQVLNKPSIEGKIRTVCNKNFKKKEKNTETKFEDIPTSTDYNKDILICTYDYDKIYDDYVVEFQIIRPTTNKEVDVIRCKLCDIDTALKYISKNFDIDKLIMDTMGYGRYIYDKIIEVINVPIMDYILRVCGHGNTVKNCSRYIMGRE